MVLDDPGAWVELLLDRLLTGPRHIVLDDDGDQVLRRVLDRLDLIRAHALVPGLAIRIAKLVLFEATDAGFEDRVNVEVVFRDLGTDVAKDAHLLRQSGQEVRDAVGLATLVRGPEAVEMLLDSLVSVRVRQALGAIVARPEDRFAHAFSFNSVPILNAARASACVIGSPSCSSSGFSVWPFDGPPRTVKPSAHADSPPGSLFSVPVTSTMYRSGTPASRAAALSL